MTGTQSLLAMLGFGVLLVLAIWLVVIRYRKRFAAARVPMSLVAAQSENVLSVKLGMIDGKKRPRPILGWKEIEMAAAPDLMVRGDSAMLADRVFASHGIVSRIRGNLFWIEDELLIERKLTRIRRAISRKTMKGRMRGDLTAEFDHTVFDEWELIATLLSEITLRA